MNAAQKINYAENIEKVSAAKQGWEIVRSDSNGKTAAKPAKKAKRKESIPVQPLVGGEIVRARQYLLSRPVYYSGHGLRERDYYSTKTNVADINV